MRAVTKFFFPWLIFALLVPSICFGWGEITRPQLAGETAGFGADMVGNAVRKVQTISELESLDVDKINPRLVYLVERGGGVFVWNGTDLSSEVATDTLQGVYVAPLLGHSAARGDAGAWVRDYSGTVNVAWFGADGADLSSDRDSIQAAIDFLKTSGGGSLYIPAGNFDITPVSENYAGLYIDFDNLTIYGDGRASRMFVSGSNSYTALNFSKQIDLTVSTSAEDGVLSGLTVRDIRISGTGSYAFNSLAKGRGILARRVENITIENTYVDDFSMIGIDVEEGMGYNRIVSNRLVDCKYTAIAINGRGYQSLISDNIISGTDSDGATIETAAIQADGPCTITNNTVFGDLDNRSTAGGITWGEGNWYGTGIIANNLVRHTRFGVRAVYHGPVVIDGNTLVNCIGASAIELLGGSTGSFTVESKNNVVSNNLCINNYPYHLNIQTENTLVVGNMLKRSTETTLPFNPDLPDMMIDSVAEGNVRARAVGVSIIGNYLDGGTRGIVSTLGNDDGAISGNSMDAVTYPYVQEGATAQFVAISPRERVNVGSGYVDRVRSAAIPTQGYYVLGSTWQPIAFTIGASTGAGVIQAAIDEMSGAASAGETDIVLVNSGAKTYITGSNAKIGIELSDGSYHWTTIAAYSSDTVTLASAVPVGKSVNSGAAVYITVWRGFANLQ